MTFGTIGEYVDPYPGRDIYAEGDAYDNKYAVVWLALATGLVFGACAITGWTLDKVVKFILLAPLDNVMGVLK